MPESSARTSVNAKIVWMEAKTHIKVEKNNLNIKVLSNFFFKEKTLKIFLKYLIYNLNFSNFVFFATLIPTLKQHFIIKNDQIGWLAVRIQEVSFGVDFVNLFATIEWWRCKIYSWKC